MPGSSGEPTREKRSCQQPLLLLCRDRHNKTAEDHRWLMGNVVFTALQAWWEGAGRLVPSWGPPPLGLQKAIYLLFGSRLVLLCVHVLNCLFGGHHCSWKRPDHITCLASIMSVNCFSKYSHILKYLRLGHQHMNLGAHSLALNTPRKIPRTRFRP